jgi:hypothetical protein
LFADEDLHGRGNELKFLLGGAPVGTDFRGPMLDALEKAGDANFDEFIEVVGGDGQELDAFEERVAKVARLY